MPGIGKHDASQSYPLPIFGTQGDGQLNRMPSQTFWPVAQTGQQVVFGAVAVASAALVANRAHHIFCETNTCWIRVDGVAAAAGDFPLALGAVYEWTPTAASVISVIQRGGAGTLVIGQSEQ